MLTDHPKLIALWLKAGLAGIVLMVLLGGATRLTQSGLSMVDWSITGSFPPGNEAEWDAEFSKYKGSREFLLINSHFTIQDFKSIYWWEYFHRFSGRLLGSLFLIPFIVFWIKGALKRPLLIRLLCLLGLGFLQGLIGWFMVKSGLVRDPHVSHYRLAVHLLNAFILFSFTYWLMLQVQNQANVREKGHKINARPLLLVISSVFLVQVLYGALVAGLRSGYLYATWPKMGNEWFPDDALIVDPAWINFLENGIMVQFVHRVLALVILILSVILVYRTKKMDSGGNALSKGAQVLCLGIGLQFLAGVLTVLMGMNTALALFHQANAMVILAALLHLLYHSGYGWAIHPRR